MELSEAKEILKEWSEYNKEHKDEIRKADTIIAVQETILKALDNSISKDEVRKKIEELELLKKALPIRTEIPRFIDYLQELLGDD